MARSQTKVKYKCNFCGSPTGSSVQSKKQKRTTRICMAEACWRAYWKREEKPQ